MLRTSDAVVALAILFGLSADVSAQTVNERFFNLLGTSGSVEESCGFVVTTSVNGTMNRQGYQLRLPDWTLSVAQLTGSGVTNAGADQTLLQSADLLKASQGAGDFNCCVDIRRTGNVGNFNGPATMIGGVITSQAESNAVFSVNADIKIVTAISFCGQSGTYAGCADGSSIIVVNTFNPPGTNVFTDPTTVSHEVGHWSGLSHVGQNCTPTSGQCGSGANACTGCGDPLSANVMYCRICAGAPNQGIITGSECSAYQAAAQ